MRMQVVCSLVCAFMLLWGESTLQAGASKQASKVTIQHLQKWRKANSFPRCLGITADGKTGLFLDYASSSPDGIGKTIVEEEINLKVVGKVPRGVKGALVWHKTTVDGKVTKGNSQAAVRNALKQISQHLSQLQMRRCSSARSLSKQSISFGGTIRGKKFKLFMDEGSRYVSPALAFKATGKRPVRLPGTGNMIESMKLEKVFYLPNTSYLFLMIVGTGDDGGGRVPKFKRFYIRSLTGEAAIPKKISGLSVGLSLASVQQHAKRSKWKLIRTREQKCRTVLSYRIKRGILTFVSMRGGKVMMIYRRYLGRNRIRLRGKKAYRRFLAKMRKKYRRSGVYVPNKSQRKRGLFRFFNATREVRMYVHHRSVRRRYIYGFSLLSRPARLAFEQCQQKDLSSSSGRTVAAKVTSQDLKQWLKKKAFPRCVGITPDGKTGLFLTHRRDEMDGANIPTDYESIDLKVLGKARPGLKSRRALWRMWKGERKKQKVWKQSSPAQTRKVLKEIAQHVSKLRLQRCHKARSLSKSKIAFSVGMMGKKLRVYYAKGDKSSSGVYVELQKQRARYRRGTHSRVPRTNNMTKLKIDKIFFLPHKPFLYLMITEDETGRRIFRLTRYRVQGVSKNTRVVRLTKLRKFLHTKVLEGACRFAAHGKLGCLGQWGSPSVGVAGSKHTGRWLIKGNRLIVTTKFYYVGYHNSSLRQTARYVLQGFQWRNAQSVRVKKISITGKSIVELIEGKSTKTKKKQIRQVYRNALLFARYKTLPLEKRPSKKAWVLYLKVKQRTLALGSIPSF